jgi:mycothiol synthase
MPAPDGSTPPAPDGSTPPAPDGSTLPAPPAGVALTRATWEDLASIAALYERCEQDRIGQATTRSEDIRARWLEMGGPDRDTLLVTNPTTGDLLAYAEFHVDPWDDELDLFVEGRVDPTALGRGLATFLLDRAVHRARAAARDHDLPAVVRVTVVDGDDQARAWHERRGFRPVRHFLRMRLDLDAAPPPPSWPADVHVRAATRDDLRDTWTAHQDAFADLPTAWPSSFDDWCAARRVGEDSDLDLWLLAVAGDAIVGVCLCRAGTPEAPETGHIIDLGVIPGYRRQGIAMALLRTALARFRERGLTGAALEVDDVTLEGAVALYQAAGLRVVRRTDVMEMRLPGA